MRISRPLLTCAALILWSFVSIAYAVEDAHDAIPIGTKITMRNWQQYRQFMPDGMSALFEGKYFWKMPADVEMNIGPTRAFAPPPGYVAATEKYGGQTQAVVLPDGRHDLKNYVGGLPFPDPSEPYKGWKILADDWLPPAAWIYAGTPDTGLLTGCGQDKLHNLGCSKLAFVYRQVGFLTYRGHPRTEPGAEDAYLTEWSMVEEPEEFKYITELTSSIRTLSATRTITYSSPLCGARSGLPLRHVVRRREGATSPRTTSAPASTAASRSSTPSSCAISESLG